MFSVVIPSYNHALYLDEALLSALDSPMVREIIIADDGSLDISSQIIKSWSYRYPGTIKDITLVPSKNIGAHATLNRLIEAARFEWIAILNSDDRFLLNRFVSIVERLKISGFDFCFGNILIMDALSNIIGRKRAFMDPQYPFPNPHIFDSFRMLASQNYIATTTNMVFKKSLWQNIGGFASYRYCHDWDFALRAHFLGTVSYIPEYLSVYRAHFTNTISEKSTVEQSDEVSRMISKVNSDFGGRLFELFPDEISQNEYLV